MSDSNPLLLDKQLCFSLYATSLAMTQVYKPLHIVIRSMVTVRILGYPHFFLSEQLVSLDSLKSL